MCRHFKCSLFSSEYWSIQVSLCQELWRRRFCQEDPRHNAMVHQWRPHSCKTVSPPCNLHPCQHSSRRQGEENVETHSTENLNHDLQSSHDLVRQVLDSRENIKSKLFQEPLGQSWMTPKNDTAGWDDWGPQQSWQNICLWLNSFLQWDWRRFNRPGLH